MFTYICIYIYIYIYMHMFTLHVNMFTLYLCVDTLYTRQLLDQKKTKSSAIQHRCAPTWL